MHDLPRCIRFGREICGDLSQAERREWWLANGLGGYAAGTIAGTLTRRYHGLLVAPLRPPLGRVLVFAKADATLVGGNRQWPLHSNRWAGGVVSPTGHLHIESFYLDGRMPVWRYAIGTVHLEARVWMEPGANTTYVAYRLEPNPLEGDRSLQLHVRLLVNARDHHVNTQPGDLHLILEGNADQLRVIHPAWFNFKLQACGGRLSADHVWIEHFDLPLERARGLPDQDNHLCVGQAVLDLLPGAWTGVVASLSDDASPDLEASMERFQAHDAHVLQRARVAGFEHAPDWLEQLVLAADSFVFSRPLKDVPDGESVIAGYPWFGEWGRDTMIALAGLTLATGRYTSARRILETFARFVDQGMLPNVFPDDGQKPAYNTVDAALWYIEAWRTYLEVAQDKRALKRVFPVLVEIIDWYRKGTRYGIGMDLDDGLLRAGEPGVQLTWMDAKVGDWVVTPRIGKPVEVNALWFNALNIMAAFAEALGRTNEAYLALAEKTQQSYQRFINPDSGGLFDVLDGPEGDDPSIRPNQIFAVSLPYSPLSGAQQAQVVRQCGHTLLCSYGLRSLTPSNPRFHPYYKGDVGERDGAYHQGPVWVWLLGHYALAEYRVRGDAAAAQAWLGPMREHLSDAGLGTISEILDGAPPHTPCGCPAQAWSVASILEAWWHLERTKHVGEDPKMFTSLCRVYKPRFAIAHSGSTNETIVGQGYSGSCGEASVIPARCILCDSGRSEF